MYEKFDLEQARALRMKREPDAHKGVFGHALLAVGSRGMMGAAVLAAKACLRAGAGLVSVLTEPDERFIVQTAVPEAMCRFDLPDLQRITAIGAGPGWGQSPQKLELLQQLIFCNKPLILDADALNLIAGYQLLAHLPAQCILTPHEGEFDRLFGTADSRQERIDTAIQVARQRQCVVVLKGHETAVCLPDGSVSLNTTGNVGMATAGSGDVLTGIITSLRAQGYPASDAARLGVWLHGKAGDLAIADGYSYESLLAGDLVDYLNKAFKAL
ncbi:MAG: NAD(P)H-hydrate dehydratase [Paludibacteraceae bacterium]|nr:NAD(P)H-hydrate dehydratase [Paludibacteraceae bacterium]